MNELISIVVPMYYEEGVAGECYRRLKEVMDVAGEKYEFIFVNDGSTDKTLEIITHLSMSDSKVKVLNLSRNFGHQNAVTAGLDYATGSAVVIIDADLQDPPELIPDLIAKWRAGNDVVYAKRMQRKGETFFKLVTAKYFYRFLNMMTDIEIPKDTGDFRLIDRKVVEIFKKMPERNRFIRGMIAWVGFKQSYVEYNRDERFAGETKYPLKKMIKFALDGVFSFSSRPLKLINSLGLISVVISVVIVLYSVIARLFGIGNIQLGWASIMVTIAFFSGMQLIALGIIGAYIARIYDESKDRPIYVISETLNVEVDEENKGQ